MKSDWDDAPDYIRNEKKRYPWRVIVIMVVGSAFTWGVVALFAKPIVINVDQLKQAIHVDGKPLFSQQQAPQTYSEPQQPIRLPSVPLDQPPQRLQQPSRADIEWAEKNEALAIARAQNHFSDENYTPKQPANTYSAPATRQVETAPAPQRSTRRERTSKWIKGWDGGSNYLAEWISINNQIDGSSVCANHRRGSIEYRECRKAAKQYYHEECRSWRAKYQHDRKDNSERMRQRYCSAANSFSPMG
ncbi:hypothetical protein SAMN05216600_116115 [Pseudomonas cuatrocienegasensis]|uniref:Uncharacterized protein n=1 Tax=Pseudomonas cuatrocienegasensis TaxID=543360 RepID=A0ABY1BM68_9PSED|nr:MULTISPECIES: hypothetical protein [Pseudomonas]OEC35168.1 hypothetical protein A7D25_10025 [Pseudomonas sp. 21C1]SER16987.1 hypothetical protein SAMN05216600_116115 [Pseudomonas cuatrocienegasensis]